MSDDKNQDDMADAWADALGEQSAAEGGGNDADA